jgi:hypothetical protein
MELLSVPDYVRVRGMDPAIHINDKLIHETFLALIKYVVKVREEITE